MRDTRIDEILRLVEAPRGKRPWFGGASVLGCLRGVAPELAAWKPAPGRHGIWELALHIAYWKYAVRRKLQDLPTGGFPRSPANWPAPPVVPEQEAWKSDRALLREEQQKLVTAVRAFDPKRLDDTAPGQGAYRYVDLLHGIVMHDIYHVGQIQVLKRLHRGL